MNPALALIAAGFLLAIALGLLARRGRTMDLEQWTVGGRGFGAILVFLLMAGEVYTTFTFLGGSGWAYGRGAPAFYILCYGAIAYTLSYFMLPVVWRYATAKRLVSQVDWFVAKYDSRALGTLVALVGVGALIPYLVLQLKGLGIIISEASYGTVSPTAAVWVSSVGLVGYVVVSGIRGSAWTATAKDLMILGVAMGLGFYLPAHYHGGMRQMFEAIDRARPGFLALPPSGQSATWFASTVFLTSLGFYMWPHYFAASYAAQSEDVFRKNAIVLPLYQFVMLFVFFIGFAAVLQVPGLAGSAADLSLLRVSKMTFGPWMLGVIGAAGLLTALVPGSMLLLTASTILAQNIYRPLTKASDAHVNNAAKGLVPVVALVGIYLTLNGDEAIVGLLLMGYSLVTQLFPAVLLSLSRVPLVSASAAFAGILCGEATVVYLTFSGSKVGTLLPGAPQPVKDLNEGTVALLVNVIVMLIVSAFSKRRVVTEAAAA